MVAILMMSAKLVTAGFLKIKKWSELLWNEGYDITNKILSRESNYIAGAVMRLKFGNSNISMRQVIITSIL